MVHLQFRVNQREGEGWSRHDVARTPRALSPSGSLWSSKQKTARPELGGHRQSCLSDVIRKNVEDRVSQILDPYSQQQKSLRSLYAVRGFEFACSPAEGAPSMPIRLQSLIVFVFTAVMFVGCEKNTAQPSAPSPLANDQAVVVSQPTQLAANGASQHVVIDNS